MKASSEWAKRRIWLGAVIGVVGVLLVSMVLSTAVASSPAVPLGTSTSPTGSTVAAAPTTAAAPSSSSNTPAQTAEEHLFYESPKTSGGPHPGVLDAYEIAPSGMTTEDPAVAYDTVSYEPILNVYQTLIAYNGSSTSNFVPELSTCVPGAPSNDLSSASVSCQDVYGQSLIVDNAQGLPEYWTFPIANASFYDPATAAHWQVYPSDVMFSLARTMSFADLPGPGVLNGWIQTQSLMPVGNAAWDGGIHAPFNNTPGNIMTSMLINDSTYCPAAALAQNGCITFNAFGEGTDWPFFLELVADALGAGVVPCGWFTAQDAGIPGWSGTAAAHGDGPCLLPGGATNTQASSFTTYVNGLTPTAWDSFQMLALNHPAVQPGVRFSLVGSGPYYGASVQQTTGYTLEANPYYVQPSGCVGVGGGCEPAPGQYINKVIVQYETTSTEGLAQYEAGQADFATFFPSDTSSVLQLQSEGSIGVFSNPTISTFFLPFDLNFSLTAEASIDPNAGELNVKGDFFASNTVRNLLTHAYPYASIENTVWTVDGVQYGHNFGGAIPIGMGDYYPSNVTWPYLGGNPCSGSTQSTCNSSVNSAVWWWTQGTTVGSPYYDAELAACSADNPCSFPIIGELGNPGLDAAIVDFIQQLGIITNGAVVPYSFDLSFPDLVQYSSIGGGQNPMPFYNLGWAPDYPDPTDYMAAMYYANGTYTYGDGTYQTLEEQSQYDSSTCGHNSGSFADLTYWANYQSENGGPIPNGCQGPAYQSMLTWMSIAASQAPGTYRVLIYNQVEQIENQLAFYLYYEEENGVGSAAKWINNQTINTNVMIGGGGDQTWYTWQYTQATANVYLNETGLPTGTTWTAHWAGVAYTNTTTASGGSIVVGSVTNGTYPWVIGYSTGYSVGTTNGTQTVSVTGPGQVYQIAVTFSAFTAAGCKPSLAGYPSIAGCGQLNVASQGLITGTSWTVIVNGLGYLSTNSSDPTFVGLPPATYTYVALPSIGYTISSGATAAVPVAAGATSSALVTYSGISFTTYSVTFWATGVTSGTVWSVSLAGYNATNTSTGSTSAIVFWEPGGNTYFFSVYTTSSLTPISPVGEVTVNAANQTIVTPFTASPVTLTISEHGFPPGSGVPWGVTVIAAGTNPTGNTGTDGGFTVPSTTSTVTFNVSASTTYNYSAIPLQGWYTEGSSGSGNVTTTGSGGSALIRFAMVTYAQSFYEVGLPTGGTWTVNASFTYPDTTVTGYSVVTSLSNVLSINLPNGTSPYTVTGTGGYTAPAGTLVVNAAPGFAIVVFTPIATTYTVTFTQSGLPSGDSWTVFAGATNQTVTTSSVSFSLLNGTYTYAVTVPSGQTVTPSGGALTVNGANAGVSLTVKATPAPTPGQSTTSSGLSTLAYELIGLFVALAVIFLITTLYFASRKPPTSNPPQSWQSNSETSTTETTDNSSPPPST